MGTKNNKAKASNKGKRYVVTSNVAGQQIDEKFLKYLLSYCKKNKAELKVLELVPAIKGEEVSWEGVPDSARVGLEIKEIALNNNCRIRQMYISPNSSDPTNGISTNTRETVIVGSPKQTYKSIANMERLPRAIISTGCINKPAYGANKTGQMAHLAHMTGAFVVEVKDAETFFPINVQSLSDGSFIDRGVRYYPNGKVAKLSPEEIVRVDGDDHASEIDQKLSNMLDEIQRKHVRVHCKLSHDTWSQRVSNHHNQGKFVMNARSMDSGFYKVEQEIEVTRNFLNSKGSLYPSVVVVPSNHNEALGRMIEEARYIYEGQNWLSGTICSLAQYHGVDPVKFATGHYAEFKKSLEKFFENIQADRSEEIKLSSKTALKNVKWLHDGQSFKFGGIELGYHGDDGANGAKGSPKSMRQIHGNCVSGHTHVPALYNKSGTTGTSTHLPDHKDAPDYAKNKPSGWMNSFIFVYAPKDLNKNGTEGTIQLCNVVNYEWQLKK
jgi:hypothetical protein